MDADRFDTLTRTLTVAGSRRRALAATLSGAVSLALGALSPEDVAARKQCPPCKKRKHGKCKKTLPDGTACGSGGTCQRGSCVTTAAAPPPCVHQCYLRECGDDGCGGSCGPCTNGVCNEGMCTCPTIGTERCGNGCVPLCPADENGNWVRNPITCTCCQAAGGENCTETSCCNHICDRIAAPSYCLE